ncbi:unnamed protein product [Urochloa humidicola]
MTTTQAAASQATDGSHLLASAAISPLQAVPRIVLKDDGRNLTRPAKGPDPDGWSHLGGRRRQERRKTPDLRCPIPVDLRGRCFNCFSPDHRATCCRSKPRCFRCHGLGHRYSGCSRQVSLRPGPARPPLLVWRPKFARAAMDTPSADTARPDMAPEGSDGRKRRRRSRRRRGTDQEKPDDLSGGEEVHATSSTTAEEARPISPDHRPRKILDRTATLSQREDWLTRALVVTVIAGNAESILATVAARFEIEVSSLSLQRFGMARFLLILPSAELAERVFNDGRPFSSTSPPLRLHVRRWSRLLPVPVEVEIRGIPAHAWELPTAELLLSDYCWIGGVHPDVADRRDVFKVVAWSATPAQFPLELDLEIVEPPAAADEQGPAKRTLLYSVKLSASPVGP